MTSQPYENWGLEETWSLLTLFRAQRKRPGPFTKHKGIRNTELTTSRSKIVTGHTTRWSSGYKTGFRRRYSSVPVKRRAVLRRPLSFAWVHELKTAVHKAKCWYGWLVYSCCSHLEHRASVKRFVSLQFLNLGHSVGLLERVISPSQGRYLTQTQNKHRHPYLELGSNPRSQRSSEQRQFMP
jgi:hypothetical protein